MQVYSQEEIIKILPKGLMTIPKKFRKELGFEEPGLARIRKERGRLVIEPVRTLPYQVRSYTDQEVDEFIKLDKEESESYLSAMLQVYRESAKAGISPLCLVTKNPTRNGKLRRLDIDTKMLLEKVGYKKYASKG